MGIRKIRWSKKSRDSFLSILKWYQEERGRSFATKFYVGILNTIDLIAQMPTVGKLEEKMSNSRMTYYSFLSHPKYRIVYRYTDTEIFIVVIRATQMNHV